LLASNRKYAEALAIAEALLPEIEDEDFAATVKEFRDHIAQQVAKKKQ